MRSHLEAFVTNDPIPQQLPCMKGHYVDLLQKLQVDKKHWAIGLFNPVQICKKKTDKLTTQMQRVARQSDSVILVSFCTTSLTDEQINALAIGIGNSCQKFIWILGRQIGATYSEEKSGNLNCQRDMKTAQR
ncbi:hypothetical protein POM88_020578 [Heracleum sosnowskyi]|uniref:Uncharacterized protein n=1 Tax=Heracleum sosnowskyi TaxID=360622 RepID=A0AAD8IED8_9APIA|nr:hypothetical protein POM88_020578 [Heracleum sosnowskyi]